MNAAWVAALVALVQSMGAASFPDDHVTWTLTGTPPIVYDAATSVIVYTATPSADVGCDAPRFTVEVKTQTVLAVHCLEGGRYSLLFESWRGGW